jgi:hypothetical protein
MNMSSKKYEIVYNFLREFFDNEFYDVAIKNVKNEIDVNINFKLTWQQIKDIICNQQLSNGEPLSLVQDGANQVLDENSDKEAYVWFDKMMLNIERNDGNIDKY